MSKKEEEDAFGDDLYADIKLSSSHPSDSLSTAAPEGGFTHPGSTRKRSRCPPSSSTAQYHPKSLTDQVAELQQTVERLQVENESLKRNMGTLFRTATAELARKDRQLQEMREQLSADPQQAP